MTIWKKLKLLKTIVNKASFYEVYRGGKNTNVWKFENTFIKPEAIEMIREYILEEEKHNG